MLQLLKQAYSQITGKSIRKCWRDTGLLHPRQLNALLALDEAEKSQYHVDTSKDPIEPPSRLVLGFSNFVEMNLNSLDVVEAAVCDELDNLSVTIETIAFAALNNSSTAEVQMDNLSDG